MTGTQNSQSRPVDMAAKRITLTDDHCGGEGATTQ